MPLPFHFHMSPVSTPSSPATSRSSSPNPLNHERLPNTYANRLELIEKNQEKAMALLGNLLEEYAKTNEKMSLVAESLGLGSHPAFQRKKVTKTRIPVTTVNGVTVPIKDVSEFSLGPSESDSEDSHTGSTPDEASSTDYSDIDPSDILLPEPSRIETAGSDHTITLVGKQVMEESEVVGGARVHDAEEAESSNKAQSPQASITSPAIPDRTPKRSKSVLERPKPNKHISFSNLLPLGTYHKKSPSSSSLSVQAGTSASSSSVESPESSSTNLKALGEEKRSHSAVALKGLAGGFGHFNLAETNPDRMRTVDSVLATSMAFGGLKKRDRSKERQG